LTRPRSKIIGHGAYLPKTVVTNADLSSKVETSDEWILTRTGIRERHIAAEGELTSDLAAAAARNALERAKLSASDIDLLIVATTTPDNTFPATAARVQAKLGMTGGAAFDIQAVCSGFIFALATADNFIKCGQVKRALVIGADTLSRLVDWQDRTTCVLFGDGAGAVVLEACDSGIAGILSTHIHSQGEHYDLLRTTGGPSSTGQVGVIEMNGKEVFKHAVMNLAEVVDEALKFNGMTPDDLDWIVPHQANRRILDGTAKKLGIDPAKVVVTVDRHANTSAASIPLALDEALSDGRIKPGQLILLEAMGGGFTWGAALVRI